MGTGVLAVCSSRGQQVAVAEAETTVAIAEAVAANIHTYLPTYIHTGIHTYIHTLHACSQAGMKDWETGMHT